MSGVVQRRLKQVKAVELRAVITVNERRCVGCARCASFCPREALLVWGYCRVDTNRCTDCQGGIYHFEENLPLSDKETMLDRTKTYWVRSCVENCPVEALEVAEE